MKTKLYTLILLALTLPGSGFAQTSKPLAERQQEFLSWKFGMFIHYGLASYNQGQWATGYEAPGTFAPTQLNCGQWADAAKAAGMKYAVFTTKHTSGYALWDSKHTTHDITAFTNYRQGRGRMAGQSSRQSRNRPFDRSCRSRGTSWNKHRCSSRWCRSTVTIPCPSPHHRR
jgi:hypothetical protein